MSKLLTFISLMSPVYEDSWVSSLVSDENIGSNSFYISGGSLHPSTIEELTTRPSFFPDVLASALKDTYQSRILDSLESLTLDEVVSLSSSPLNPEMGVLVDLWILVRSDVHLSEVGPAYSGTTAAYASIMGLETAAVMNSTSIDHWTSCHVKHICRPYDVLSCLNGIHSIIESGVEN